MKVQFNRDRNTEKHEILEMRSSISQITTTTKQLKDSEIK